MRQNYKAGEMGEMENTATCQALVCENFWSFQLIFSLKRVYMELAQTIQKTSQGFCFQVQKIRLFYV